MHGLEKLALKTYDNMCLVILDLGNTCNGRTVKVRFTKEKVIDQESSTTVNNLMEN